MEEHFILSTTDRMAGLDPQTSRGPRNPSGLTNLIHWNTIAHIIKYASTYGVITHVMYNPNVHGNHWYQIWHPRSIQENMVSWQTLTSSKIASVRDAKTLQHCRHRHDQPSDHEVSPIPRNVQWPKNPYKPRTINSKKFPQNSRSRRGRTKSNLLNEHDTNLDQDPENNPGCSRFI